MIDTDRLTFRPFRDDDLHQVSEILGDPNVMAFSDHGPLDHIACCKWLTRAMQTIGDDDLPLTLAVLLKSDERLIGYVSLANDPHRVSDHEAELGFRLAYDYWGRGIATEAARAMVAHATCLAKTQRVVAILDPNNRQSVRVLLKIGMTYERDVMFEGYDYPDHRFSLELAAAAH
ncbi:MAG: GNAT family N-acetyltransferase [Rhodobacteraceae bacterium]|nr:GNAT family N-acetyltransferase [Paracoccaceae bacterium]